MARIVVFGATGFTGRLVSSALVHRGHQPLLAGRSQDSLDQLQGELGGGLDTAVADISEPTSFDGLLGRGDLLVTTVGPFLALGDPALDAAISAGAHYMDTTGEGAWVQHVLEAGDGAAREKGILLLPAIGLDYVPGNLAGALAMEEAGDEATRLDVGYFFTGDTRGGLTRGTVASAMRILSEPIPSFRGGELISERAGARVRTYEVNGRRRPALTLGSSEAIWMPRLYPQLRDVDVHQGGLGAATRLASLLSPLTATLGRGVLRAASRRIAAGKMRGPDAEQRQRSATFYSASASGPGGEELARVELIGPNVYEITAEIVAWCAERVIAGETEGEAGAMGPVEAFGLERLEAGARELGLARAGARTAAPSGEPAPR